MVSSTNSTFSPLLNNARSAELVDKSAELVDKSAELVDKSAELVDKSAKLVDKSAELVNKSANGYLASERVVKIKNCTRRVLMSR